MDRTLWDWALTYQDTEDCNALVVDQFRQLVNATEPLREHRDFIEQRGYGFGDRSFHWLWKLIIDELPCRFSFLEIGVFKGQVISLARLLASHSERTAAIYGITMLNRFSGITGRFTEFPNTDYLKDIVDLHRAFGLEFCTEQIICADSTSLGAHERAKSIAPLDVVYIDGCHEYDYVRDDLTFYPGLLRPGGFLVVDDSACFFHQPWGFFQGIVDVSEAVRDVIEPDPQWEHLLAVMHNRVWMRLT